MKSIHKSLAIIACLVFGSAAVSNAQVKIGTNPTNIEAASNLEVEASTANRKVKVDKVSGQLTIADGTQGAAKVLTSDVNGGASWQISGTACGSFDASRPTDQSVVIQNNVTVYTTLVANTELYDPLNAYNTTTGLYTVPANGFYSINASSTDIIVGVLDATRHSTLALNSAANGALTRSVQQRVIYGDGAWNNVSTTAYLAAGDVISLDHIVTHVAGTKPATNINVRNIRFSATRVDCDKN